ncbi:unnamed protein product [Clonostachys rosea]|uniref:CHAT domain-containing protein n=1 Tax=Bionectria ochroleuca TaxID=29856 RepID=A0ABY6UZX2_BIOOC|nr:unnamed protein product [Clonostachys rosea]
MSHILAAAYIDKYINAQEEHDGNEGIRLLQESLGEAQENSLERDKRLELLGAAYWLRYENLGHLADIDASITHLESAISIIPKDQDQLIFQLKSLGRRYKSRYRKSHEEGDLEAAISKFSRVLDLTKEDHPEWPDHASDLAAVYQLRYADFGGEVYVDLAIRHLESALKVTPQAHTERAARLHDLATSYYARYHWYEMKEDLDVALQLSQEALDLTPENDSSRADRLHTLGMSYSALYGREPRREFREKSFELTQQSVLMTPKDDPYRSIRLKTLGSEYHSRFIDMNSKVDLDAAIEVYEEAADLAPQNQMEKADALYLLGVGIYHRYSLLDTEDDLDKSIEVLRTSFAIIPPTHPQRGRQLAHMAIIYRDRYKKRGQEADIEAAIELYRESLHNKTSPISARIGSGMSLFDIHINRQDWSAAAEDISTSVFLIPHLTPRFINHQDKQYLLSQVPGVLSLASHAAAVSLRAEKPPYEAVRLLEIGRGTIISSLGDLRSDVSDLQQEHPELAAEYIQLCTQLDGIERQAKEPTAHMLWAQEGSHRYNASQKMDDLIQVIQRLPGFESFLVGLSEIDLKNAAVDGPIVVVNTTIFRCDALLIEQDQIRSLLLPQLDYDDIESYSEAVSGSKMFNLGVLEWLWSVLAKPILDTLGFIDTPTTDWPRIWWVPTGLLTKFPIHAAGNHVPGSTDTVLDRVVSSYSSSIKAIIQSRANRSSIADSTNNAKPEKAVLVATKDLLGAPKEVDDLHRICESIGLQVTKPLPRKAEVLAALNDCHLFHFAGHGQSDFSDPSNSAIILDDQRLTVSSLIKLNLQSHKPFLAYLSACGTGQMRYNDLSDEGLHLISAFQLAGFQHVIGTLWEVNDEFCTKMARTIYDWMKMHGISDQSLVSGLHHTSRNLRDEWVLNNTSRTVIASSTENSGKERSAVVRDMVSCDDVPLYWVPFVHFGI